MTIFTQLTADDLLIPCDEIFNAVTGRRIRLRQDFVDCTWPNGSAERIDGPLDFTAVATDVVLHVDSITKRLFVQISPPISSVDHIWVADGKLAPEFAASECDDGFVAE